MSQIMEPKEFKDAIKRVLSDVRAIGQYEASRDAETARAVVASAIQRLYRIDGHLTRAAFDRRGDAE